MLAGLPQASIIHGVGGGVLRRVVAEVLADHPSVETFELDRETPGGDGVTLVRFKEVVA